MGAGEKRRTAATPWGTAAIVEEVAIPQSADGKEFASLVQLLEGPAGEPLVRFAYTTGGVARRGPVTFREADLAKLREALSQHRSLARALGLRAR
jgi:hypothetical protein